MARRIIAAACFAVAGAVVGIAASNAYQRATRLTEPELHFRNRTAIISAHAVQKAPKLLVIGDSNIERSDLTGVCGGTLNAGVSSARVTDFLALPDDKLAGWPGRIVAVHVGVNDVARDLAGKGDGPEVIARNIALLADRLARGGRRVVVFRLPVVARDAGKFAGFNAAVARVNENLGLAGLALAPAVTDSPGTQPPGNIHFNAQGSKVLRDSLSALCPL